MATAGLPDAPAAAPDAAAYRAAPLPAERPPALAANLPTGKVMGSPVNRYDDEAGGRVARQR